MSNNSQSVGANPKPLLAQPVGEFKKELYAAVGGGAVTFAIADLIAEAVAAGSLLRGYKTTGAPIEMAAPATAFAYKVDADLKPLDGGLASDPTIFSTSSNAKVIDEVGFEQDIDPQGSRTYGQAPLSNGYVTKSALASIWVEEGSIVEISIGLSMNPALETTL